MAMFVVLIIGFFAAALAQAQLVANQHELDVLRTRIAETEADRARLERSVEESSAPAAIIDRAAAIGMVRANEPMYLAAVGPAPEVVQVSVLGAVTASTDGSGPIADAVTATSADPDIDLAIAMSVSDSAVTDADAESAAAEMAAPVPGGLAGTRAVTAGISSG